MDGSISKRLRPSNCWYRGYGQMRGCDPEEMLDVTAQRLAHDLEDALAVPGRISVVFLGGLSGDGNVAREDVVWTPEARLVFQCQITAQNGIQRHQHAFTFGRLPLFTPWLNIVIQFCLYPITKRIEIMETFICDPTKHPGSCFSCYVCSDMFVYVGICWMRYNMATYCISLGARLG
jgi:hypothetical protein